MLPAAHQEPGTFPPAYLHLLATQRAAAPGDVVSLRVEGTDAATMTRGKVITVDQLDEHGTPSPVGLIVAPRTRDGRSRWIPPGSGPIAVTLEGYRGDMPLYFDVPDLAPATTASVWT
jgi:hypothetical protein